MNGNIQNLLKIKILKNINLPIRVESFPYFY